MSNRLTLLSGCRKKRTPQNSSQKVCSFLSHGFREILKKRPFNILVFVGENQARIPFEMDSALQEFGKEARYIKISGNGPNALDFHIACYRGQLSTEDKDSLFKGTI